MIWGYHYFRKHPYQPLLTKNLWKHMHRQVVHILDMHHQASPRSPLTSTKQTIPFDVVTYWDPGSVAYLPACTVKIDHDEGIRIYDSYTIYMDGIWVWANLFFFPVIWLQNVFFPFMGKYSIRGSYDILWCRKSSFSCSFLWLLFGTRGDERSPLMIFVYPKQTTLVAAGVKLTSRENRWRWLQPFDKCV